MSAHSSERRTFPLIQRRRRPGLPFGDVSTRRRGHGSEPMGHRPYEPGDPVAWIDWFASARLSATTGADAFVVRQRAADEAPRVVVAVDRSPAMALYPEPLPWLAKRVALREAVAAIVSSAAAARADTAALDFSDGEAWWLPPGRRERPWLIAEREQAPFTAPGDTLERALEFLGRHRSQLPAGTFVFLLSDFLTAPSAQAWQSALARGWEIVPVVIQDPVWERSFPDVGGVAVPIAEPREDAVMLMRFSRRAAQERRDANERRHAQLLRDFQALALDPVLITSSVPEEIDGAFLAWAEVRRRSR
ncbi:MAG TPA: DUF58 domain-containing protein [Solirubrobacteraceae bacterium]